MQKPLGETKTLVVAQRREPFSPFGHTPLEYLCFIYLPHQPLA